MTHTGRHILLLALLCLLLGNAAGAREQYRATNSSADAASEFCGKRPVPQPAFVCPVTSAKVCLCYLKASHPGGQQSDGWVQDGQLLESDLPPVRVRRPRSTPRLLPEPSFAELICSDAGSVPTPPPRA